MSYSIFCYRKNNKAKNCILNNYQIPTIVFTFNEAINVLSFNQVSFRFFFDLVFSRISFWIASHDFQYKLKIAHNYRYFKQSKVGGGVQSFFTPWFILLVNDWVQKTLLVLKLKDAFSQSRFKMRRPIFSFV